MDYLVSEPIEQSKDVLGTLGDIFTGALSSALDLEIEKQRADINAKPLNADTQNYVRGNDGTVQRGQASSAFNTIPPWVWMGAIVGVGVIALLSLQKG